MEIQNTPPNVQQEVREELSGFESQTYWNKLYAGYAGLMVGIAGFAIISHHIESLRERFGINEYHSTTPSTLSVSEWGDLALATSPMFVLPFVAAAGYKLYRRKKYNRLFNKKVDQRIGEIVLEFGEELDEGMPQSN